MKPVTEIKRHAVEIIGQLGIDRIPILIAEGEQAVQEGRILQVITVMRQEQDFDPQRFLAS